MNDFESTYESIHNPEYDLIDQVETNSGNFQIFFNPEVARRDLLSDFETRDISAEKLRLINLHTCPVVEFSLQDIKTKSFKGIQRRGIKMYDLLSKSFGMVKKNDDGHLDLIVDARSITEFVANRKKIPGGLSIPHNLPERYLSNAIEQSTNLIWNHEKTHVIQSFSGYEKYDEDIKTARNLQKGAILLQTLGLTLQGAIYFTPSLEEKNSTLWAASQVSSAVGLATFGLTDLYIAKYSRSEREAYSNRNTNGPFKINKLQ